VDGIVRAAERCKGYAVYNLGNSNPVELSRLVSVIGQALGRTPHIQRKPMQPGDVRETFADVSLAGRELGYRPTTNLEEGIRRYVAWYRAEGE
jgi:Nucleoside-diphosphate-sugar epimerases